MSQSTEKVWKLETDGSDWYKDQDGISHESPEDWLWSFLGGCGCGSHDEILARVRTVFHLFGTDYRERGGWSIYDDLTDELIAHWLDHAGLIEHGSGIGGSWLTDKGHQVYNSLKALGEVLS